MRKGFLTLILAVIAAAATAFAVSKASSSNIEVNNNPDPASMFRTVKLSETDYPDLTYSAETALDAVVFVKVTAKSRSPYDQIDPFLRYFFGFGEGQPRERQGSGSGVIIRPDGYIVTNNHVVADATKIEITLNNNKSYEAKLIGTDPATDVALIKVEAAGLPYLPFGDSDKLRLGEWVLAIGSPLGEQLKGTITAGIVSAKGRSMPSGGEFKIESFIQTDAAVNPGNSGGALVNKKGELVGINTAIVSQTGAYSGYSFAVPVNIVKKIVGDLMDFGTVKRARLGVTMGTVNDKISEELKLSSPKGVYIDEVLKGSAAEKAGMKHADVVIAIDGTEIATAPALQEKVNGYHPGDKAEFTVIREGKEITLKVEFQGDMEKTGTVGEDGAIAFYGSKIKTADKETLAKYNLKRGVLVTEVAQGKMLDAGAVEGFIILYVNAKPVSKAEEVLEIAKAGKRAVYIEGIDSNGREAYFAFGKEE